MLDYTSDNMKTKYILILAMILLSSCSSIKFDPRVKELDSNILKNGICELAYDIIDNPDKLMNFKESYPQFYDSTVIFYYMSDKMMLKSRIDNIKKYSRPWFWGYYTKSFAICTPDQINELILGQRYINIDTTKETIFIFRLKGLKNNLNIYFIKRGLKYCVLDIEHLHVAPID